MQDGRRAIPEDDACRCATEARGPKLGDEIVLSVASPHRGTAVQDRRLAAVEGKAQVASEVGELRLTGRVHAVEIEAGLAYRDDPRMPVRRRRRFLK